uniref:Tf2-1-like SH3-like domain-containing protein n=1 Tax=Arundo donax TaxID=35708 RepID=A0A0A9D0I5_ARUDO
MQPLVKQHFLRAQQHMKLQADKKRSERAFEVGECDYLKLQPYVQSSVATRANHKLSFKYYEPFLIIKKVGTVAYQLDLPPTSAVHLVFHVSQLKKAFGAKHKVISILPHDDVALQIPLQVLDNRMLQRGSNSIAQVLVR